MEKASSGEVDMEEWEILSDDGFLDFQHKDEKGFLSRDTGFDPKAVIDMNYFICPSPRNPRHLQTPNKPSTQIGGKKLVPVPVRLEPMVEKNPDGELVKDIGEVPMIEINVSGPVDLEKMKDPNWVSDQDTISQVFFKKMKENEFVDMKMDSPWSGGRGLKPQIDLGAIQFEEKEEEGCKGVDLEDNSAKVVIEKERGNSYEEGGLNIWKLGVTGIGALCSVGVAAAAVCIFIFGSHQRQKLHHQNEKLRFQIYADDKSIKQVVHHATRLNQALGSVRGVPLARAQITFGGYYDGL
ncbi:hypothetical protein AAC387_Pa05g2190 [Persea americana]